jgi:hypothetical protein
MGGTSDIIEKLGVCKSQVASIPREVRGKLSERQSTCLSEMSNTELIVFRILSWRQSTKFRGPRRRLGFDLVALGFIIVVVWKYEDGW